MKKMLLTASLLLSSLSHGADEMEARKGINDVLFRDKANICLTIKDTLESLNLVSFSSSRPDLIAKFEAAIAIRTEGVTKTELYHLLRYHLILVRAMECEQ